MDSGSSRRRKRVVKRLLSFVLILLVLTSGCLGSGGTGTAASDTPVDDSPRTATESAESSSTPVKPPTGLDSRLFQLVTAENRTAYADTHDLDVRDGRVLVAITLVEDGSVPDQFDVETELTRGDEVLGYVRIDALTELAQSPDVVRVEPPERGTTNRITASQQSNHFTHS